MIHHLHLSIFLLAGCATTPEVFACEQQVTCDYVSHQPSLYTICGDKQSVAAQLELDAGLCLGARADEGCEEATCDITCKATGDGCEWVGEGER